MIVEQVLFVQEQQVFLYKIPTVSSNGYQANEWQEIIWEGGIKLTEKGGQLILYFINKDTQEVQTFVNLPDNPYQAIEQTQDCKRGYAIRLVNPIGNYQWVGCLFRDRNDAFCFNENILRYIEKKRETEGNQIKLKNEMEPQNKFELKVELKNFIPFNEGNQQKGQNLQQGTANASGIKFVLPFDDDDFGQFTASTLQQQTQSVQDSLFEEDFNSSNQPSGQQQNQNQQAAPIELQFQDKQNQNQTNSQSEFEFNPINKSK